MWILYLIRDGRRYRRRVFGPVVPDWVDDLLGLLDYINLFLLLPTIYMIVFQPRHFFKSIPAIRNKAKRYYAAPIKFASTLALGLAILIKYVVPESPTFPKSAVLAFNGIIAMCSPIVIAVACVVILALWGIGNMRAKWLVELFPLNYHGLLIPLDPDTYKALNWKRYLRSLWYYYLYFYLALAMISLFMAFFLFVTSELLAQALEIPVYRIPPQLLLIEFSITATLVAVMANKLLIRPYIFLLISSTPRPTKRMELFASFTPDHEDVVNEDRRQFLRQPRRVAQNETPVPPPKPENLD